MISYDLPKANLKEKIFRVIIENANNGTWENPDNELIAYEVNVSKLRDSILELIEKEK